MVRSLCASVVTRLYACDYVAVRVCYFATLISVIWVRLISLVLRVASDVWCAQRCVCVCVCVCLCVLCVLCVYVCVYVCV